MERVPPDGLPQQDESEDPRRPLTMRQQGIPGLPQQQQAQAAAEQSAGVPQEGEAEEKENKNSQFQEMEDLFTREHGIGGVRPEAMLRHGIAPSVLIEMLTAVESRVEPLDVGDLILGQVSQKVPIIPGKLEVEFRQTGGKHEDLVAQAQTELRAGFVKRMRKLEMQPDDMGEDYDSARAYCEYTLACSVKTLKDRSLPDPVEASSERGAQIKALNQNHMIISGLKGMAFWIVWVNYVWFLTRCSKAISAGPVKNG